jgi:phosphate transport system substrate-binding protein
MSLGLVGDELKTLSVDGVPATTQGILEGKYPLAREFFFVRRGPLSTDAQSFVDFVLSPDAQHLLELEGLVRVK